MRGPAQDAPAKTGPHLWPPLAQVLASFRGHVTTPSELAAETLARVRAHGDDGTWICLVDAAEVLRQARKLEVDDPHRLPLYGVPFGVKDSLDIQGLDTTLACPDYAYRAAATAPAVQRLLDAGALLIGKTNLDQFATGLNGTRTPYPIPRSVYGNDLISGGSSSGSARAVATGQVPFSVATDTAGSGRVPAAMNGIVGFKPSRGLISTVGLVPACRSLDCVSVMAGSVADARAVFDVMAAPDPQDPWHRRRPVLPPSHGRGDDSGRPAAGAITVAAPSTRAAPTGAPLAGAPPTAVPPTAVPPTGTHVARRPRIGLPDLAALEFFGDEPMQRRHEWARSAVEGSGHAVVAVDLEPFSQAGALLYQGPWVVERMVEFGDFLGEHPDSVLPVIRTILQGSTRYTAADVFRAQYRLQELRAQVSKLWREMDVLLLPTIGTTFTVAQVLADPITCNTALGHYTHFANLLDLCAVAVPAGVTADGRPASVMILGPALADDVVLEVGEAVHEELSRRDAATKHTPPARQLVASAPATSA